MNRRARLRHVLAHEGRQCVWCRRDLEGLVRATTEHLIPRTKGGPSWIENEVAACRRCNAQRGNRALGDWIDECERRGWEPRRDLVLARLEALEQAIDARGGQRRARPYLAAQLRRLRG